MKTRQNELRSILERILQMAVLIFFTAILILPISVNCMAEEDEEEWHEEQKQGEGHIENYIVRTKPLVKQDGYTEADVILAANVTWAEVGCYFNRIDAEEGFKREIQMIVNRMNADCFPDTMEGVIYQKNPQQFATRTLNLIGNQQIPDEVYKWVIEVLNGDFRGPDNMVYADLVPHGEVCYKFGDMYFCTSPLVPVDEEGHLILSGKATKSTEVKNTEAENQVVQTAVENVSVQSSNVNSGKDKKATEVLITSKYMQKGSKTQQQILDTNVSDQIVMSERDILAEIIFYENSGFLGTPEAERECKETATIFVNRKNSDQYPNTLLEIVNQEGEFSQYLVSSIGHQGDIPEVVYKWTDEILVGDVLGDYTSYQELEEIKRQESLNALRNKHQDTEELAQLMYAELGKFINEPDAEYYFKIDGQVALNRKDSDSFPNTLHEVIYQIGQYEDAVSKIGTQNNIPEKVYKWANDLLEGESIAPGNLIYASENKNGTIYDEWNGFYFGLDGQNVLEQEVQPENVIVINEQQYEERINDMAYNHPIDLLSKIMYAMFIKRGNDVNDPNAEETYKAYGAFIMKRVKSENWPNTVWEVISQSEDLYEVRMSNYFYDEYVPENVVKYAEDIWNGEYETINVAYEPSNWHMNLIQETTEEETTEEETTEVETESVTENMAEETTEATTEITTENIAEETTEATTETQETTEVTTEEPTQSVTEASVQTQIVSEERKSEIVEVKNEENLTNELQEYSDVEYVAQVMFIDFLSKYFEDPEEYLENPDAEKYAKLVGQVVINRRNANICPNTIKEVIYQQGQYEIVVSEIGKQEIPEIVYQWAKELLEGESVAPENLVYASENVNGEMYDTFHGFYFGTIDLSQYN